MSPTSMLISIPLDPIAYGLSLYRLELPVRIAHSLIVTIQCWAAKYPFVWIEPYFGYGIDFSITAWSEDELLEAVLYDELWGLIWTHIDEWLDEHTPAWEEEEIDGTA